MANRKYPHTGAGRFNDRELARIDAAARLRGLNRAQYVRQALLERAEADLRAELDGPAS